MLYYPPAPTDSSRVVPLEDVRVIIDGIDKQIQELLMQRLDCSTHVAVAKQVAGSTDIYRADREQAILDKLSVGIPKERLPEYQAVVRKITETSRMFQYHLLYHWNPELFNNLEGSNLIDQPTRSVSIRLTRVNRPNAMSSILSMVGDYGFNMEQMTLVEESAVSNTVTFDLDILGDCTQEEMRTLLFQLSKESANFRILGGKALQ